MPFVTQFIKRIIVYTYIIYIYIQEKYIFHYSLPALGGRTGAFGGTGFVIILSSDDLD